MPDAPLVDVIVVGGGPAGWSAALVLGRACRQVLLIDAGHPRNRAARALHAFLTREGTPPLELLCLAREEALRYPGVRMQRGEVTAVSRDGSGFGVRVDDGRQLRARKLLLATGVVDELPSIPGLEACYGRSVHHCPYCDGWEHRNQPLVAYGRGEKGIGLALMLTLWSHDVALCTHGTDSVAYAARPRLADHGIALYEQRINRLEADEGGNLQALAFEDGTRLTRRGFFFHTASRPAAALARDLDCAVGKRGSVAAHPLSGESSTAGVYVAGDASRDVLLAIVAAAEGAKAAIAINKALMKEEGRL